MTHAQQVLTCLAIAGSALVAGSCATPSSEEVAPAESTEVVVTQIPDAGKPTSSAVSDEGLYNTGENPGADQQVEVAGITKSISDPNSIWILTNKHNPLSPTYEPPDLVMPDLPRKGEHQEMRAEAAQVLAEMSKAADLAVGKPLQLVSGYRSYADQKELYDRYVEKDGQADADTYSARPGFSEHQTGLVADLSTVNGKMEKFGDTELGEWVAENSWKYGFILRYTPGNHNTVGYQSEPWHYRYVGKDLAAYIHQNNIGSLEEALNQPAAPNYQ